MIHRFYIVSELVESVIRTTCPYRCWNSYLTEYRIWYSFSSNNILFRSEGLHNWHVNIRRINATSSSATFLPHEYQSHPTRILSSLAVGTVKRQSHKFYEGDWLHLRLHVGLGCGAVSPTTTLCPTRCNGW
jgi:hypothetical protein